LLKLASSLTALSLVTLGSAALAEPTPTPAAPAAPASEAAPTEVPPTKAPETAKPPAEVKPKASGWKGFRIQSEDGAYQLRIGGQLQVDAWGFPGDEAKAYVDEVRIRRMRVNLRATVAKHYDFRLLVDFADARLQLLDAVIETTHLDEIRLRVGKDKSPVSFDRLQSGTALLFLERSATTYAAPNRDLGLQLVGKIGKGLVDYQLGLWDGAPDGATVEQDTDDGFDFAGRITFQPFVSSDLPALKELLIGASGSFGAAKGTFAAPQVAAPRSSGRAAWFKFAAGADLATTVVADGDRARVGGHLYWRYGPVSLFGEFLSSSQELALADVRGKVTNTAYVAQATALLTGDDASWSGVKPTADFDPSVGGSGAVELAVRWTELAIGDEAFDLGLADPKKSARKASSLTVGVNWYLNPAVKLQLDYERTSFKDGAADGDRPTENLIGARAQLLF
jgi:phosphate-selective porin OprO/OprP